MNILLPSTWFDECSLSELTALACLANFFLNVDTVLGEKKFHLFFLALIRQISFCSQVLK